MAADKADAQVHKFLDEAIKDAEDMHDRWRLMLTKAHDQAVDDKVMLMTFQVLLAQGPALDSQLKALLSAMHLVKENYNDLKGIASMKDKLKLFDQKVIEHNQELLRWKPGTAVMAKPDDEKLNKKCDV